MNTEGILHLAARTLADRQEKDSGRPEERLEAVAKLWRTYLGSKCVPPATPVELEAEDVAALLILERCGALAAGARGEAIWAEIAGCAAAGGAAEEEGRS